MYTYTYIYICIYTHICLHICNLYLQFDHARSREITDQRLRQNMMLFLAYYMYVGLHKYISENEFRNHACAREKYVIFMYMHICREHVNTAAVKTRILITKVAKTKCVTTRVV